MDKPLFVVHSFPFYISDWRDSETRLKLTAEARGVFWELLCYCYREGSIPTERESLIKIAAVTNKEFDRSWPLIKPSFSLKNGRYHHQKVDDILIEIAGYHEQRRKAGIKSGAIRKGKKSNENEQPFNERSTSVQNSLPVCLNESANENRTKHEPSVPNLTTSTSVPNQSEFSYETAFEELWQAYPAKGRTRRILAQQVYCELLAREKHPRDLHCEMLAPLAPGGAWEQSDQWAKGFIMGIGDYLSQWRWRESPIPRVLDKMELLRLKYEAEERNNGVS